MRFSITLFFIIAAAGAAADLLTKQAVFDALGMPGTYGISSGTENVYWIIPNFFGFQTSLNSGALFGIGQGKVLWLAGLSVLFLLGIAGYVVYTGWHNRFLTVIFACISAGIIGNLFDRLALHGLQYGGETVYAVRDWILFKFGPYYYPNFNIADSFLVCSTIILAVYSCWVKPESKKSET